MRIAALFPGQGSQIVGMGLDFYRSSEVARALFGSADKTLGFALSKLCFEGPIEELTLTKNVQPALLVTSYIAYKLSEVNVISAAGHSLGEYTALVASGSIQFTDAVSLVHKRGIYMQEAVKPGQGKMVAVMGLAPELIAQLVKSVRVGVAEVANFNSPAQTVVAGDVSGVEAFTCASQAQGAKIIPLKVSAPFHCSLMKPAAEALARDLDATTFQTPAFPVYANVTAKPIHDGNQARILLKEQVCGSVRWAESMNNMIAEQRITHAVEFGPSGVLSKLFKKIDDSIKTSSVSDQASLSAIHAQFC